MAANLSELRKGHSFSDDFSRLMSGPAFSSEAWHAMSERDNQLIADSILHGYAGEEYIYSFKVNGSPVEGVSVIGARELAAQYGGIQARLQSSADKAGSLIVTKSYGATLAVDTRIIPQIEDDDDWYECVIEVTDIKTGNSITIRKKEFKNGTRRDGTTFPREHYDTIAESKAYRNGVLAIIPQSTIKKFKEKCRQAGRVGEELTRDQILDGLLAWSAKHKVSVDRKALQKLTYNELRALGANTKEGQAVFRAAAAAAGVLIDNSQVNGQLTQAAAPASDAPDYQAYQQAQEQATAKAKPATKTKQAAKQAAAEPEPEPEPETKPPGPGPNVPPEHADSWTVVSDAYDEGGVEAAKTAYEALKPAAAKALHTVFRQLTGIVK